MVLATNSHGKAGAQQPARLGNVPYNPMIRLTGEGGVQWLGSIQLGTPRQVLTVTMDTGSSDLLVIGKECRDCT